MTKPRYKIGILGVGHLMQHVVPALVGDTPSSNILLSPRNTDRAAALKDRFGCAIAETNHDLVDLSETVLLAVRPTQVEDAIAGLPWRPDHQILSFCAGVTISQFSPHVNGATVARALPVTAAEFGDSPTILFPDNPEFEKLLEPCGPVFPLKTEDKFEVACLMGAYYGWTQMLIGNTARWLSEAGLEPGAARRLTAAMTRAGATTVLERPQDPVEDLVEELCLPGSITGLGRDSLMADRAFDPWDTAFAAVLTKLRNSN
ncbi:MAG: NAD(P)-binding domain-containing protein [Rhizobiaceae bacterium]